MLRTLITLCHMCCWLALAMPALTACSNGAADPSEVPGNDTISGTYYQITLQAQPATRANANSLATEAETTVNNATILLYRSTQGINGDENITIDYALYAPLLTRSVTSDGAVYYTTGVLHNHAAMTPANYHALIIANMGDLSSWVGHTLGQVRDETTTAPYQQTADTDPATASHFVMTSNTDCTINATGQGGLDNPIRVTASIERLAARLDFSPAGAEEQALNTTPLTITLENDEQRTLTAYYTYQVTDGTATNGDVFYLTTVTPFNLLSSGSYLFKRVTDSYDTDAQTTYLGAETTSPASGQATNYVVDPWTWQKTLASRAALHYRTPLAELTEGAESSHWPVRDIDAANTDADGSPYYTLCYAEENTLRPTSDKETYATGIMVKGIYGKRAANGTMTYTEKQYTWYVRHSDPTHTAAEGIPMKYGIVRNNIYRLRLNAITSLGLVLIEVRDWTPVRVPDIEM